MNTIAFMPLDIMQLANVGRDNFDPLLLIGHFLNFEGAELLQCQPLQKLQPDEKYLLFVTYIEHYFM